MGLKGITRWYMMNAIFSPPIVDDIDKELSKYSLTPSSLRIKFNDLYNLTCYYYERNYGSIITKEELMEKLKQEVVRYRGIKLIAKDMEFGKKTI